MNRRASCFLLLAASLGGGWPCRGAAETWAPVDGVVPAAGFVVDMGNRMEALYFYQGVFMASEGAENRIGWTGTLGFSCQEGTTSPVFRADVQRRVNYYRALCGLPANITFDAEPAVNAVRPLTPQVPAQTSKYACAQAAAFSNAFSSVFFDDFQLNHEPAAAGVACYSSRVWNGDFHSNLALGYYGPRAVDAYIADDNLSDNTSNNSNVGHRRWILYSRARDMSSGDVPPGSFTADGLTTPSFPSNALYIQNTYQADQVVPRQFVTWPPQGYVPVVLKPLRWSISFPNAVFSPAASDITLKGPDGKVIPVTVLSSDDREHGDNTLVFLPQQTTMAGSGDATFSVTVTGMSGPGVPATHTWQTTFFDPSLLGLDHAITGPANPSEAGANYQASAVPFASCHHLRVNAAPPAAATYVENGDGTTPDLVAEKTGTYPLLQGAGSLYYPDTRSTSTFTPRSGSRSMHLCFPLDASEIDFLPHNQSFSLGPEFIPSATSVVSFQEYFRWLFTNNRLSLEISVDGGAHWTELYGRNGKSVYGVGKKYSAAEWDTAWSARSVPLSAYAGRPVRLRFMLRHNDLSFDGADIDHGCYIDDINLTGVRRLAPGVETSFSGTALRLDQQSAGAPLQAGTTYLLRVRPQIGVRLMGYSPLISVTVKPPTGYEAAHPALAAHPLADADGDGIANFIEYAFGLNAQLRDSHARLPQPVLAEGTLKMTFTIPPGIRDLVYGAECSSDLLSWSVLPNSGSGANVSFAVPVAAGEKCYLRLKVSQQGNGGGPAPGL
jgi:hypothetical protein